MKKLLCIIMGLAIFLLIGCNNINEDEKVKKSVSKNDIVTYALSGSSNTDRLEKFINNLGNKKKDKVSLITQTIEGDPITTQLYFNGQEIEIFIDRSKDEFGGPDKDKIIYDTIKGDGQLKENLLKYLKENHFIKVK